MGIIIHPLKSYEEKSDKFEIGLEIFHPSVIIFRMSWREERDQKDLTLRVWVGDTAGIRRDQPQRSSPAESVAHKLGVGLHARLGPWVGKWNERNGCPR